MLEVSTPHFNPTSAHNVAAASMPVTRGLPLVGSLPQLLRNPFGFAEQARSTYGDIYKLDIGMTQAVMLNHPRHAQYVLRDNAQNYRKGGAMWDFARTILGNGLVVSEGDYWLRQRRMMQPQFHRQRLAGLTELMIEAIEEAFAGWDEGRSADQPFNLAPAFNQLTMRVIVKTLFGTGLTTTEMDQVGDSMGYVLDYLLPGMLLTTLPDWTPFPGKTRFNQSRALFDEVVYRIIAQSRGQAQAENNLLAMLLDVVDEETNEGMTDQQLHDEIATLFLAGYETTSITLSWAIDYLTSYPEVMQKLRAEVDSALGDRRPAFADLPNLPYTKMVLQETMRLRPPSFWLPRTAVADDQIDGYSIPAGTNVVSLTYMYHRHPEFWPTPEKFDPERFTSEASADRHRFAWIPFGAGNRLCIGRDFSLMEGQLALAMLVQRYDIERVNEALSRMMLSSTLRLKDGVHVHLKPRRNNG